VAKDEDKVWAEAEAWVDAQAKAEEETWAKIEKDDEEEQKRLDNVVARLGG